MLLRDFLQCSAAWRAGKRPLLPSLPRQDYGINVLWLGLSHGVHAIGHNDLFFTRKEYIKKSSLQLLGLSSKENVAIKHWNMTPSGACLTCLSRIKEYYGLRAVESSSFVLRDPR